MAVHVIRLDGYLDVSRYPDFREAFIGAPRGVPALIDLQAAEGVDSTFLSEMLLFRRRHDAPVVALIPKEGNVAQMFMIADVGQRMNVFADPAAARAALDDTEKRA